MIKVEPITIARLIEFYGEKPTQTMIGFAAMDDDRVLGVVGLQKHPGFYVAFSDMKDEMRQNKKSILKAGKMLLQLIRDSKLPVLAMRDDSEPTSHNLLRHLGFVPTEEPEVYLWQR